MLKRVECNDIARIWSAGIHEKTAETMIERNRVSRGHRCKIEHIPETLSHHWREHLKWTFAARSNLSQKSTVVIT
jgi:hypothetical protein